jgi:hypothetical protein
MKVKQRRQMPGHRRGLSRKFSYAPESSATVGMPRRRSAPYATRVSSAFSSDTRSTISLGSVTT